MWVDKVDRIDTDRQKVSKHQKCLFAKCEQTKKSLDFKIIGFWTWVSKKSEFDKETNIKVNCKSTIKGTKGEIVQKL